MTEQLPTHPLAFDSLVAVVTGASGGLGRGICVRLVGAGCHVIGTAATTPELESARSDRDLLGVDWRLLDVTDGSAVQALFDRLDRVDVLINLAGIGAGPAEFEESGFIRTVDVNLFGTMRACYAAHPLLARSGGSIVNTASVMSFFGSGSAPAYSASKGAVALLTKSLAVAWAHESIRVNAVAPGWIETPMTTGISQDQSRSQAIVARTPLGRWGTPNDVAEGVLFLASPNSSFVTGVILPVDGGYTVDGSPRPTQGT
jgi:NAD(P)-dependent dehydrogenase (short-subunit alcohol dehydrogenase family)